VAPDADVSALEPDDHRSLFLRRIRDLVRRRPVSVDGGLSAAALARRLSEEGVGSVVVVDADGAPVGIVTDRDLRRKVVAEGRDTKATQARAIMSAPLVTLPPDAFAFEAMLAMTRHGIRHVVVVAGGRLVGVVSSQDFFALQTTHPVAVAREIERAPSLPALAALGARVTALVSRLVADGGTAYDVGQLVAELNDRIVVRVLGLTAETLAADGVPSAPVPYCWLTFGSEARREQTLRTDQDNGLVYADPPPEGAAGAAAYYARFASEAIRGLVSVGFPPCPGNAMASNPRWCQPLSVWTGYFRQWMDHPSPEEVLAACIYFDLRPLAGAREPGEALAGLVRSEARQSRVLLGLLARDVVVRRVPLTLLGNLAIRRQRGGRGTVDVKSGGVMQLTGAARVAALELGLGETNTIDRIRAAGARGLYRDDEVREIADASQHLMRLRLVHQLAQIARGETADNRVAPATLSRADRLLFVDALRTVERVQGGLRQRFATDRLG
jgi:CBS domain-containing protein